MSKAILISIKPKYVAKILNGEKTIEVRKNKALASAIQKLIDENGFVEFYVYCTKSSLKVSGKHGYKKEFVVCGNVVNGKVAFKFRCYKVEEISWQIGVYELEQQWFSDFLDKCCLGFVELKNYLNKKNGYAIHINDLEIFDKPKELNEFYKVGHYEDISDYFTDEKQINSKWCIPLKKAPQNFCYMEVE